MHSHATGVCSQGLKCEYDPLEESDTKTIPASTHPQAKLPHPEHPIHRTPLSQCSIKVDCGLIPLYLEGGSN